MFNFIVSKTFDIKKIFQLFLLAITIACYATAQPVLTQANVAPFLNESIVFASDTLSTAASAGGSGANQNWDFSTLGAIYVNTFSFSDPNLTSYATYFPGTNLSIPGYLYFNSTDTDYKYLGNYLDGSNNVIYTTPEEQLRYPFTYGNSYTQPWAASGVTGGIIFNRTGSSTVSADGYGTLTTPAGVYNNARPVHLLQIFQDDLGIWYKNDQYLWYVAGLNYYAASVNNFYEVFALRPQDTLKSFRRGYYVNINGVASIKPSLTMVNLFPNPCDEQVSCLFHYDGRENISFQIINYLGQVVRNIEMAPTNPGRNEINISTIDFVPGSYFAVLRNKQGEIVGSRYMVVKH